MIKISDFIAKLKQAHDVPNYYNNHFPYNCGYYDGMRYSWDCWNLIKTILAIPPWEDTRVIGSYVSPKTFVTGDCDGYHLLLQCTERSRDFSKISKAGTYLYMQKPAHAGIYLGDFEYNGHIVNVVECTGAWEHKVQYTYLDSKGIRYQYKGGQKNYAWTDYGILPYIDYEEKPMATFGIDISGWQNGLNIAQAKAEGVQFAVLKAGGAELGYNKKDSQFETFYSQCKANGIPTGSYYFGRAFSVTDAVNESNHFISYLQGKDILHVWYDVEGKMLNQDKRTLTDIIKAFCDTMISAGYVCGVYTSLSHFNSSFYDTELVIYPHWVACYGTKKPTLKSGNLVEMWQFGGTQNYIRSNKIAGKVCDQNYCYFDIWGSSPAPSGFVLNGYDYSPVFDPNYYANRYPDLMVAFGNDANALWNHFCTFGMNEFRQASAEFNPIIYKQKYPDVAEVCGDNNPLYYFHYVAYGKKEGRSAV